MWCKHTISASGKHSPLAFRMKLPLWSKRNFSDKGGLWKGNAAILLFVGYLGKEFKSKLNKQNLCVQMSQHRVLQGTGNSLNILKVGWLKTMGL